MKVLTSGVLDGASGSRPVRTCETCRPLWPIHPPGPGKNRQRRARRSKPRDDHGCHVPDTACRRVTCLPVSDWSTPWRKTYFCLSLVYPSVPNQWFSSVCRSPLFLSPDCSCPVVKTLHRKNMNGTTHRFSWFVE